MLFNARNTRKLYIIGTADVFAGVYWMIQSLQEGGMG